MNHLPPFTFSFTGVFNSARKDGASACARAVSFYCVYGCGG